MTGSACPVCGTDASSTGQVHADRGERYRCFQCTGCDLAFWSPREIRPETYVEAHVDTYARRHRGEAFLRDRHHMFLARPRHGRLLDVGCGEGSFVAEAARRGLDAWGAELDGASVEVARGRVGDRIVHGLATDAVGRIDPAIARVGRFDWVTAFEVLEHQPDLIGFLRALGSLIADGGSLCGSVPNRGRAFAARSRRRSNGDLPPHHFLWFSPRALEAALRAAGFAHVEVSPVRERDPLNFAAYLETSALGALTTPLKRRAPAAARAAGAGASPGTFRRALRLAKNLPFVPLAVAIDRLAPRYVRGLYFEAVP